MKFTIVKRFGETFYFSGIYKICGYVWFNGGKHKRYYQCYHLIDKNWGDYCDRSKQYNKTLTLGEAKQLCIDHAKTYVPSNRQVKNAVIAMEAWAA